MIDKKNIQLLDCTLRDGSYIVDGNFGDQTITGLIGRLSKAGVDIIECGWLKDSERKNGSAYFHQPSDAGQLIGGKNEHSLYTAMIDYNRYDTDRLEPCDGQGIDAVRVVFPKEHADEGLALVPKIKAKGYKVLVQAANTYGYEDLELIELAKKVNEAHPSSISIVDTFGAMYRDDLYRIMSILDNNLDSDIMLGFHSHNNQQMSFVLAQDFVEYAVKKERAAIVDSSLCGMGRGAGNANTELVADYLNRTYHKDYDLDLILDTIDIYMNRFIKNYQWGYSVPLFIAGMNCTHVNNIAYLLDAHRAKARDIEHIISSLPPEKRTAYDYASLEKAFLNYMEIEVDDEKTINDLKKDIKSGSVLLIAPGRSAYDEEDKIKRYMDDKKPVVISINWMPCRYECDFAFFSNIKRYEYAKDQGKEKFMRQRKIVTSNLKSERDELAVTVNYNRLLRRGWKYFENSLFLCLRLMNRLGPSEIGIAGFDGLGRESDYNDENMESAFGSDEKLEFNRELAEMMDDYIKTSRSRISVKFVTRSIFDRKGTQL